MAARKWLYCSFADEKFLGAVIIRARDVMEAAILCHRRKINPGGQVMCGEIPRIALPPVKYRNRLLTRAEIVEFWPDSKSLREWREQS